MTDEDFAAYLAARFPPRVEPVADPLADLTRERDAAVAALAEREAELGRALASLAQMRGERDVAESFRAEAVRTLVSERSKWAADEMVMRQERDFERERANEWLVQLHDARKERDEARVDLAAAPTRPVGRFDLSIEPHGDGEAMYLGRGPDRHGYNIAHITETDPRAWPILRTAIIAALSTQADALLRPAADAVNAETRT